MCPQNPPICKGITRNYLNWNADLKVSIFCKGQILFLIIKKCHFTIDPSPSSKISCDDKQSCLQKYTPLMNIGEECKTQFGCENGHCPSCGFEGLCCRKDVTGCGCSGLVGGETRHECTRDAGMTIYNIFLNTKIHIKYFWIWNTVQNTSQITWKENISRKTL